jgi:hypothetical protein
MNHGFRRIVSMAAAILIALSSVLVCAPVAKAAAPEGHCKPVQTAKPACSHCPQKHVMDCCATSAPQPASVPQDSQQQGARSIPAPSMVQADGIAIVASLQVPALARVLRGSPLHGYRSTDLPTLNAVFLI